ncbi:MAG: zinc metalloprotease HtpX [Acidobacteria bacterium]|nr:zinc metalloprotease HtpX [Acidobacteriota bacterium]MCL5287736.1 zinc metalloprotease HtpX [Acidobacteriota bacterium]
MNTFKTALLLTALTLMLLFGGQLIGGQRGMTFALAIAVAMNGVAYFFSDKIALSMSGAKPVTREEAPRLYQIMDRLCGLANLPMPKLYVIPEAAPNAFATGRNPRNASVAVTAGLLNVMTDEEIEGVLAHELSHVRNYDILTASVAATIAGAITHLAFMGRFAMIFGGGRDDDRGGGGLSALLMLFLAPLAATFVQLAISRQREFAADASAAQIVGHPFGLIHALEKLGAYNKRIPMQTDPSTASLYIVAPLSAGSVFMNLFSTHPKLEDRIAALKTMIVTR